MSTQIFIFVWTCVFFALTLPVEVNSSCYPDKKQACDLVEDPAKDEWNTSMRFFLFTRKNSKDPEMLHMCKGRLPKDTHFNPKNKLIVFVPGFLFGLCELKAIREIKDELLLKGDFNVMLIDNRFEYGADYMEAIERLPKIAKTIVKVLKNIQEVTKIKNDKIDFVTHSLGAQTASYVGSLFKIHRITGIDPAGIQFGKETPLSGRLDPSDAELVDIIHCNGGNGLPYLSIPYSAGHADFYINGGSSQPNCLHSAWEAVKNFDFIFAIGTAAVPTICSHVQCLDFYKLSINNKHGNFTAWNCDNYDDFKLGQCDSTPAVLGFNLEEGFSTHLAKAKLFPKKYYLQTLTEWPYVSKNGTYRSAH